MFYNANFYIFVMLLLFAVLLFVFNIFIPHHYLVDVFVGLLGVSAVAGFLYLIKFPNANMTPFYLLYSALLVGYVLVFAGTKIYSLFN